MIDKKVSDGYYAGSAWKFLETLKARAAAWASFCPYIDKSPDYGKMKLIAKGCNHAASRCK